MGRLRRGLRLAFANGIGRNYLTPRGLRRRLLRLAGAHIGRVDILSSAIVRVPDELSIGDGTFINHNCYLEGRLTIGRDVFLGPGVTLAGGTHELGPSAKRAGANTLQEITIEDGVWIGANAVILGDVVVARGCVIGAGAVVTASTEPDGLYLGVPARRVRDLP